MSSQPLGNTSVGLVCSASIGAEAVRPVPTILQLPPLVATVQRWVALHSRRQRFDSSPFRTPNCFRGGAVAGVGVRIAVVVAGRVVVVCAVVVAGRVVVGIVCAVVVVARDVVVAVLVVVDVDVVVLIAAKERVSPSSRRRSTPPFLPSQLAFLLSSTTSPDLHSTDGASQRAIPLWLLHVFENSRLSDKLPSLHSANIRDGTVVVEPVVVSGAAVLTLVPSPRSAGSTTPPASARTAIGSAILAHMGHPT